MKKILISCVLSLINTSVATAQSINTCETLVGPTPSIEGRSLLRMTAPSEEECQYIHFLAVNLTGGIIGCSDSYSSTDPINAIYLHSFYDPEKYINLEESIRALRNDDTSVVAKQGLLPTPEIAKLSVAKVVSSKDFVPSNATLMEYIDGGMPLEDLFEARYSDYTVYNLGVNLSNTEVWKNGWTQFYYLDGEMPGLFVYPVSNKEIKDIMLVYADNCSVMLITFLEGLNGEKVSVVRSFRLIGWERHSFK